MGHRSITSTTLYENSEPNQDIETYTVKAVTSREEAEKLIALGYDFITKPVTEWTCLEKG